jgi:putative Ca2+/H+ antiporter (TMEM165/GDT1 family)
MDDLIRLTSTLNGLDILTISSTSYLLIFAAEMGDKSQLVCMALAARYRAAPVMLGSGLAFLFLNTIAVVFGVAIASWIPNVIIAASVAILFTAFGIHALRAEDHQDDKPVDIRNDRSILLATFMLITIAEFGDKTQLAVVALTSTSTPIAVWIGSTLALVTTSALGVWAGRTLLQRISITLLHRISGMLFLVLALLAMYKTYLAYLNT